MKINMLKGERFEVNPEEINVTFSDVKGVSLHFSKLYKCYSLSVNIISLEVELRGSLDWLTFSLRLTTFDYSIAG